MKRAMVVVGWIGLCVAMGSVASGAPDVALDGLALMDWGDIEAGTSRYSGAVASAVVLEWHGGRGYPDLLSDETGDGCIDHEDLRALAGRLGKWMGAEMEPIVDPHLVDVLARYMALRCPDRFSLWNYDPSFPEEYRAHWGRSFDSATYQDIEILDEPCPGDIFEHLCGGCPGIVGVGSRPDDNRYAVMRSCAVPEAGAGWPVGFVNAESERFGPEPVWKTVAWEQDGSWGVPCPDWTPIEALMVLIPIDAAEAAAAAVRGQNSSDPPAGGTSPQDGQTGPSDLGEEADLEIEMRFGTPVAAASEERYLLYVWSNGPDTARNVSVQLERPNNVGYAQSAPGADSKSLSLSASTQMDLWHLGDLFVIPSTVVSYLGAEILSVRLSFDPSLCGQTVEFRYGISSDTFDPDLGNNSGILRVPLLPCDGPKPNLWVTDVTGCWKATEDWVVVPGGMSVGSTSTPQRYRRSFTMAVRWTPRAFVCPVWPAANGGLLCSGRSLQESRGESGQIWM